MIIQIYLILTMILKVVLTVKCNKFGQRVLYIKHFSISIVKFIYKKFKMSLLYGKKLFLYTFISS